MSCPALQARGHEMELMAREKALAEALSAPVGLLHCQSTCVHMHT